MNINGFAQNYQTKYETGRTTGSAGTDFGAAVGKAAPGAANIVDIDADAMFSICHARTGESANVYRADGYSEDNPVYLVKGIDQNGNPYEQTVDVSKVDPNHCSYTEMLALQVHIGNRSDKDFLTMSILKDKADHVSYYEKADYLSMAYGLMEDMKTLGNWDGYLRYGKWINDISREKEKQAAGEQGEKRREDNEEKSETEILMKADGSKVMMTTIRIGGTEAVMSVEIARPTGFPLDDAAAEAAAKAFETVGPNAPERVRRAWMEAAEEVGANGLGIKPNGMLSHISQMMVQRVTNQMQGRKNPDDILGSSVESAISAVRKAIYDIDNPLRPRSVKSIGVQRLVRQERQFYQTFLNKLTASH